MEKLFDSIKMEMENITFLSILKNILQMMDIMFICSSLLRYSNKSKNFYAKKYLSLPLMRMSSSFHPYLSSEIFRRRKL